MAKHFHGRLRTAILEVWWGSEGSQEIAQPDDKIWWDSGENVDWDDVVMILWDDTGGASYSPALKFYEYRNSEYIGTVI